MIKDIKEINLPSYVTLDKATVTFNDMGEKTITTQVSIDGQITPNFSFDWEVEFKGERYIMPLRQPQGSKDNTSWNSKIDLTFQHWAIYQLKRWYFFSYQSLESGIISPDKYIDSVSLNLKNFCNYFGQLLNHYYGDTITIDLNPDWKYIEEPIFIDINYSYMWDVLIKLYELFDVRWEIVPNKDPDHYTIKVGYPVAEISHIFEYGFDGGLLKVERQVQDDNIRNMLLGRGGDKNIPYRYFKNIDPQNPSFQADPDWVDELANVYIDRLRSAEFRSYIQGWKAAHISKYPNYTPVGELNAVAPWAYRKGYTDTKFDPTEYVKDDDSIRKYGELMGGLGNNDEIYPSIQGVVIDKLGRIDQAIDVEQVINDVIDEREKNQVDSYETSFNGCVNSTLISSTSVSLIIQVPDTSFTVPSEYSADILPYRNIVSSLFVSSRGGGGSARADDISTYITKIEIEDIAITDSGKEVAASGIPPGNYQSIAFRVNVTFNPAITEINLNYYQVRLNIAISNLSVAFAKDDPQSNANDSTFDIWIKNIWQTTKLATETDEMYAERVWKPILGNHLGDEAAICFSSGLLSTSQDYEFLIKGKEIKNGIHYDTSKSLNGVQSHWRLTLIRSKADYDSLGKLVPNLERQGKAGDYFYFTGIELTQYYVEWAEKRLHDYKLTQLGKVSDIQPSWVVSLDKVRIGTPHFKDTQSLLSQLHIGGSVTIADKRFIGGSAQLYLYLQQITYKYNENADTANLTPDVEVVLGTEYATTANPVATIQSQINAIYNQLGGYSLSNLQQIVRMVGDRIYLRKDGITDHSQSKTYFAQMLAALGFRQGIVGGYGWGIYQDENGRWVIEADRVNVRDEMQVNTLVINQIQARGGMIVESAASLEISRAIHEGNKWRCYFDTKNGTVGNLFQVDDIAYCHRFTKEEQSLKYYKRRVLEVNEDNVVLSLLEDVDGQGKPSSGDVIVHYGNYTDKERQFVIIRDMIGGGYERMLGGLDSVTVQGNEYYFAGYQSSSGERFFIGTRKDNQYIEYKDGKLYIPGQLILGSSVGEGQTMIDYFNKIIGDSEDSMKEYADNIKTDLNKQIDGKIQTWYQDTNPSTGWRPQEKLSHIGDLWYCTADISGTEFKKDTTWYWDGLRWNQQNVPEEVFDKIDGKADIFLSQPSSYKKNDLWFLSKEDAEKKLFPEVLGYDEGTLLVATYDMHYTFDPQDWAKKDKYTDDTTANKALDEIAGYEYIKDALINGGTVSERGLTLTNLIALGTGNPANALTYTVWAGISGLVDTKGETGIAAWFGGDMVDYEGIFRPSPVIRHAKTLFRFDGSGYLADGNITWTKNGDVKVKGDVVLQTLGYKQNTKTDDNLDVANGFLSYSVNQIKLPALSTKEVRVYRVLNPKLTKSSSENLTIYAENPKDIFVNGLDSSGVNALGLITIEGAGYNSQTYIEISGAYDETLGRTVWYIINLFNR